MEATYSITAFVFHHFLSGFHKIRDGFYPLRRHLEGIVRSFIHTVEERRPSLQVGTYKVT